MWNSRSLCEAWCCLIGTPPSVPTHYTDKAPHSTMSPIPSFSYLAVHLSLYASVHLLCSPQSLLYQQKKIQRPTVAVSILHRWSMELPICWFHPWLYHPIISTPNTFWDMSLEEYTSLPAAICQRLCFFAPHTLFNQARSRDRCADLEESF